MLAQRVLTAVVGVPILLTGLYFGGVVWQLIVFALVLVGLLEFAHMGGERVYLDYLLLAGLSFLFLTYSGIDQFGLTAWLVLQLFYYLIRAAFGGMYTWSGAINLLGVLYVAVPLSFLWLVRAEYGFVWSIFGLVVTWLTDTGAYFGGLRFGRRKLLPEVSPKKTQEGALSGLLAALLGSVVFALALDESVLQALILGFVLSIAGQVGDLVESAIKRERSVKDSGSILPGHGGILDRFDSMIFVFPTLYVLLSLFI
ncbi:MAG: CDP-archaeol synthase [Firmicutes bacterium]|jgi:phosphatidate cytidylyltransferase|nr:CDP-archaeol synthase [Bacillota bacterium]